MTHTDRIVAATLAAALLQESSDIVTAKVAVELYQEVQKYMEEKKAVTPKA